MIDSPRIHAALPQSGFAGFTASFLREYFFPSGCGGCGEVLRGREEAYYGLCGECGRLCASVIEDGDRCEICGKPLISEINVCLACRENAAENVFGGIVKRRALFPYTGKFRAILGSYKFEKNRTVGNFFSQCLKTALAGFKPDSLSGAAWVPVPPRPGKIRRQGWDQVEHLAKLLARDRGRGRAGENSLPVRRCLKRLPSRSQKELNRDERSRNLEGHILCVKPPPRTAVVFDDVITTGATLSACARALLKAGAEKVYAVSLFYD